MASRVYGAMRRLAGPALGGAALAGAAALHASGRCEPAPAAAPAKAARSDAVVPGVIGAIGKTPLLEIRSLSDATGCRIVAKAEHLNPGGSVKDRPAARIILLAEQRGDLPAGGGGTVVEGTGGNTGVGMAMVAAARGHRAVLVMPDSISKDKIALMEAMGARVVLRPAVPFDDPGHYVHTARRIAEATPGGFYGNQFESLENMNAHLFGTGPEIWEQAGGRVDGFVCAAGTGGTIAGVSHAIKERNPSARVYVIDPPGSSLASFVDDGVPAASPGTTVTEGIGIGRITANFAAARVDGAFRGSDEEAVAMMTYLLKHEGLLVGPSAALNLVGAVKLARVLGKGSTVATIICDGGERYRASVLKPGFLAKRGLAAAAEAPRARGDLSFVR
ncbi:hypothetical protein FNF27_04387 [Cafeteria roenbergensis]|uniref:Tryptophan synthase beta chain-like PALP domain-containing protein n=2 Tax=Cafeteria roenbergensis TaxID=33653 RepID=A0A5A8C5H9_CAFRO|nr:hypothetical protein FNF28_07465 [Cafeteria roenbergensis]KAA0174166.1 hypothetical protein FNF27_04387 [Cafeteria roenbergensis]